jgi:hypothetical protein
MTQTTIDLAIPAPDHTSPSAKDANRCSFLFPNRKRCRLLIADSGFTLCFHHAKLKLDRRELADLSSDLLGDDLSEFRTTEQINDLLSRVVRLLAQNRISPRRAAVLTYAASLLLRSVVVMDRQAAADDQSPTIIWDSDDIPTGTAISGCAPEPFPVDSRLVPTRP